MRYIKKAIKVKPYVAKYIRSCYADPFILTNTNFLGVIIFSCLQKKNALKLNLRFWSKRYDLLTDRIDIHIPDHLILKSSTGIHLPPEHCISINHILEEKILEELFVWFYTYEKVGFRKKGFQKKDALQHFCERYKINIEKDINSETILKAYDRHKKDKYKSFTGKAFKENAAPLSGAISIA